MASDVYSEEQLRAILSEIAWLIFVKHPLRAREAHGTVVLTVSKDACAADAVAREGPPASTGVPAMSRWPCLILDQ
jgi:hypothetical protein